jgi:hypothetical protein
MVIVSGIIHQERWFTTTNIDDNTLIAVPDNGCLNDVLSLEWLKHFEQFTIQRRHGKWRLLILDGYGSHGMQDVGLSFRNIDRGTPLDTSGFITSSSISLLYVNNNSK